jgi:hypothetical protein
MTDATATQAGSQTQGATDAPPPLNITPHTVMLPNGSMAEFFTREEVTRIYRCSHGELGRLLARHMAPLPIRVDGQIIWHVDECIDMHAQVLRTLARWRR